MKLFSWGADGDNFVTLAGVDSDESLLITPRGREIAEKRGLVKLREVLDQRGVLPIGDVAFTGLPQPKVFGTHAWDVLRRYLVDIGTAIPARLVNGKADLVVWFPSVVVDCVDNERSVIFESFSGFRKLVKPVFRSTAESIPAAFVVLGFEHQDIWVTQALRDVVQDNKLTGSLFGTGIEFVHT